MGALGFDPLVNPILPARLLLSAGVPTSFGVGRDFQVLSDGTAKICPWGSNNSNRISTSDPSLVYPDPKGQCFDTPANSAELAVGDEASCVRLVNGTVVCWGYNALGELGNNDPNGAVVPPPGTQVFGALNAVRIVAGQHHFCGIPTGNQRNVMCWGNGVSLPISVSMKLPLDVTVVELGAGIHAAKTCAIISDGSIQCWAFSDTSSTAAPVIATW
jgi:alpha-tubulin suppressor-like RCC1 family protein